MGRVQSIKFESTWCLMPPIFAHQTILSVHLRLLFDWSELYSEVNFTFRDCAQTIFTKQYSESNVYRKLSLKSGSRYISLVLHSFRCGEIFLRINRRRKLLPLDPKNLDRPRAHFPVAVRATVERNWILCNKRLFQNSEPGLLALSHRIALFKLNQGYVRGCALPSQSTTTHPHTFHAQSNLSWIFF